ncbi:MAG: glycosyltransferase family 2 protein [Phycisphaerae bacterium]
MKLSIVTTLYRSARFLDEFHRRCTAAATALFDDFELVLVNDGSPDDSLAVAVALQKRDARVRVVDLSRNFGHHKAMMTGLAHARGELIFLLDSDLEEPPELLAEFAAELRATGAEVIYGVQKARRGGWLERASGRVFYALFNAIATDPIPPNLITARLMTRRYVDALLLHTERAICISGLWAMTGFEQRGYEVDKGYKGSSSYDLVRKLSRLVDAVTSFSNRPLIYIFYLGCAISGVAALAAVYLVLSRIFFGTMLAGWPSLIVSIWLLGGLTIFCLGVIGIYLSKIFVETKRRPLTIVRQVYAADAPAATPRSDTQPRSATVPTSASAPNELLYRGEAPAGSGAPLPAHPAAGTPHRASTPVRP